MSIKHFGFLFILMFIVSACGSAPTPTATADVPATAQSAANTMVAGTLTAMPTNTLAPTNTPEPTLAPTSAPTITLDLSTQVPQVTDTPAGPTALPAVTMTLNPNATPTIFTGTTVAGNVTGLDPAYLEIDNLSGQPVIYVTLTCHTSKGSVITYNESVTKSIVIQYVVGAYDVLVQIPNKRYMSLSYSQTNKDKSVLSVYLTRVVIHGP